MNRIARCLPLFLIAAIAACLPHGVSAEEAAFGASGGKLRCMAGSSELPPPALACLRIGPVGVGDSLRDVAMIFGKERQSAQRGAVTERVYPIDVGVAAGQRVPYWVIGFEGQRAVSVQITGDLPVPGHAFSGLRIGDPEAMVTKQFGAPGHSQPIPQIGGTMLAYPPYPVTFEIRNGRIYSMRVSEAVGR